MKSLTERLQKEDKQSKLEARLYGLENKITSYNNDIELLRKDGYSEDSSLVYKIKSKIEDYKRRISDLKHPKEYHFNKCRDAFIIGSVFQFFASFVLSPVIPEDLRYWLGGLNVLQLCISVSFKKYHY